MAVTRPISWNGSSLQIVEEMGMDGNVEAGHTTFVRCRIVVVTVLMRCRFGSASGCIMMIDKWGGVLRTGHGKEVRYKRGECNGLR